MSVSLTVTIDRSGLGKTDLVLSAAAGTMLGLTKYVPPGRVARLTYMPDNPDIDGSEVLNASWQQAMLGFNVVTDEATSEADVAAAIADLVEAVGQFSFTVTTQVGNAAAQSWAANRGSIDLASSDGRTFVDLRDANPEYAVTIPVYPIPGA